jgi:hypothetical protein
MVTPATGRPRGRPKFKPTAEQMAAVQVLVACGFNQEDIAAQIINPETGEPLSSRTMRKSMRAALDGGKAGANALVAKSLFKKATGSGPQAVSAAIFWLKCQAGWKEAAQSIELSGPQGAPIVVADAADLSKLSTNDLINLEAVLLKLQPPVPGQPDTYAPPDEAT